MENKICPIMTAGLSATVNFEITSEIPCQEDGCALWLELPFESSKVNDKTGDTEPCMETKGACSFAMAAFTAHVYANRGAAPG